jgi:hypothetical protein
MQSEVFSRETLTMSRGVLSMLDSLAKLLPFSDILSNVLTFMVLVGIS